MEHVNDWCFLDIYKGGLWEDDLDVCARLGKSSSFGLPCVPIVTVVHKYIYFFHFWF